MIAAHQEKVGCGQHRDRDPGVRQAAADLRQTAMIDGGQLGGVTDCDPSAPAMRVGLPAYLVEVHPRRIKIEIEMKIDI